MNDLSSAGQQAESTDLNAGGKAEVETAPVIYLASLDVENFRGIEKATFKFQPGLNVIIGANSTSKTALIDSLRIVLNLGTFEKKRDFIKVRSVDVFLDRDTTPVLKTVSFKATFRMRTDRNPGQFYELFCDDEKIESDIAGMYYDKLQLAYSVNFQYSKTKQRYEYVSSDTTGGPTYSQPVKPESLDYMRAIYLAPMRDLINDKTRVGAEIESLIESHTIKGKEDVRTGIPQDLQDSALELIKEVTGNTHQVAAGENLSKFARPYNIGKDSLSFMPAGVGRDLLSTMVPLFEHGLHGQDKLPLSSNGLGINQLVYASIVLSRRGNSDSDRDVHRFFLIEEPEAHLHPQLQDSFFSALNEINDHQLFVTSHSPTITAKSDIDKIIVLQRDLVTGAILPLHLSDVFAGDDRADDKRYLHKFLDVTRSQLLFAHGAIFVEGVTEAMLMQPFSEFIGLNLRDHAVELVVVDSNSGFDHFRPLFDYPGGSYYRAAFITDSDVDADEASADESLKVDGGGDRFELSEGGNTALSIGCGTFEFGLLRASTTGDGSVVMQTVLTDSMKTAAPAPVKSAMSEDMFAKDFLDFEHPLLSYRKMKCGKSGAVEKSEWYGSWTTNSYFEKAKSDFAFYLAEKLASLPEARTEFVVPSYITRALKFVVDGPSDEEASSDGADTRTA